MTISKHVALPFNTMGDSPLLGSGSVNPNIDYRLQKLKKKNVVWVELLRFLEVVHFLMITTMLLTQCAYKQIRNYSNTS